MKDKGRMYMQYICKNSEVKIETGNQVSFAGKLYPEKKPLCNRIFIAEDLYKHRSPETWRYCPDCESKGFPVIREDPDREKAREAFMKRTEGRDWFSRNKSNGGEVEQIV